MARFNSVSQARFYIEHLGADFSDYQAEHQEYQEAMKKVTATLSNEVRVQIIERPYLPNFIFGPDDIVMALGQDGMVANTLKYLDGQVLVGINPSPHRYDGILVPFDASEILGVLHRVLAHNQPQKKVTLGKVTLNDGQVLYAVNDFFIGQKTHVSARYQITLDKISERQSSSGIIVSTGLGATGWLKSILAMAKAVANTAIPEMPLAWDTSYLIFTVREPFPSNSTGASLVFGKIDSKNQLKVLSHMPENGVIFSDGIENDFLEFRSGVEARVGIAEKVGLLATKK